MGQLFYACAYDVEQRECSTIFAETFPSDCYTGSVSVYSIHYLLRLKPYRVMWKGDYVLMDDKLRDYHREEDLLGLSTCMDLEYLEKAIQDLPHKDYYDKVKFIGGNNDTWKRIEVFEEAQTYFDWPNTYSVKLSGYLLNRTKKQAVDLDDYYNRSKYFGWKGITTAIDAVPVLTETGGGTRMAFLGGISADTTEHLVGKWCGDLLEIVEDLPDGYEVIDCCFAEIWSRCEYCHKVYGVDENGYVLDAGNQLFRGARLTFRGRRSSESYIKVEKVEDGIKYVPVTM